MELISSAFRDGEVMSRRFTRDGQNTSPPLSWTNAPKEAKSFALICEDPDAPRTTWYHWAIFDIPADRIGLDENVPHGVLPAGVRQAQNDFYRAGYDGPSPPRGYSPHRYRFRLFALSVSHLPLGEACMCTEVLDMARCYALAEAQLTGLYARYDVAPQFMPKS
jgi:Raf kinase inhibitor-like YbhB/YbcL family protein